MLEDIRRDLEAWLGESECASFRRIDPEELLMRYPRATAKVGLAEIGVALDAATARGEAEAMRRLSTLRAALTWSCLRQAGARQAADIEERLARTEVPLTDGVRAAPPALRQMRGRAPAREARAAAERALAAAAATVSDDRLELVRRRREAVQEMGAKDVRDLFQRLEGVDLVKLADGSRRFLEATRDMHRENLGWLLSRHEGRLDTAESHDLAWIRHDLRLRVPAPSDSMNRILSETLRALGLDPSGAGRLRRTIASTPPTIVARRRIPGDVHLRVFPADGLPEWSSALDAWTFALQAVWTPAALPFEDRALGDPALPPAWSAAVASAVFERDWIARTLDFSKSKDAAREFHAFDLLRARHAAALFLAEIDLSTPVDLAERLSTATLLRHSPALALEEVTPFLQSAHALRARAGAASLARLLEKRFESWPRNTGTGRFLSEAWSAGRRYTLDEMLDRTGAETDAPGALTLWFAERLA